MRPFPGRPRAAGKFLFAGDAKLFLRGVTYGTFREAEDGHAFPESATVARDFSRMARAGVNAVRTYTVPPPRVLAEAQRHGLGVLVGLPWEQHVDFLSDRRRVRSIVRRVADGVATCAAHPAVIGYAVGNEIPSSIVRWRGRRRIEGFIRKLYDAAKAQDPDALVTYANFPTTEYLQLPFLDFLSFNVFLESPDRLDAYVARLQNLAGERPLVLTEIGLDGGTAGLATQAASVGAQIRTAFAGGCAGAFVFSWTDEWHRSGEDVVDWEFGLTGRDRRPKPALVAATRAFASVPVALGERAPSFSVVVCVYNAEATIEDCLDGVTSLDYPDYEVIVIDDGSTDRTAALAARYDVRLARTENRGLSRARNTGIDMATGEIVAFIDGDARPDPHWLHYLAHAFTTSDFAGVGGPNIQPDGDRWTADCVAAAPGGPIHVLSSDRVAEHIPGCNMAFRRRALLDVGGFDPRYRVAGDDVDLCWRLQERGWVLGFHAGAMVWHHHRDSVGAFWRQQSGYGRAEALLEARWPDKYNSAGHVTWGGRVYGRGVPFFRRSRVYHGTWGTAPFQPLHTEAAGLVASLSTTPEWFLLIGALAAISVAGLLWPPLLLATPLLVLAVASVVTQAARRSAALMDRRDGPFPARLRFGATTFALHLLQPLARLVGRVGAGLTPWRLNHGPGYPLPFARTETAWTDGWTDPRARLAAVESALRRTGERVCRGGAYADWDLDVHHGPTGRARVRMAVEEHGGGHQLWRFRIQPRIARASGLFSGVCGGLGVWAMADGATGLAGMLLGGAALVLVRAVVEAASSTAAAIGAVRGATL